MDRWGANCEKAWPVNMVYLQPRGWLGRIDGSLSQYQHECVHGVAPDRGAVQNIRDGFQP